MAVEFNYVRAFDEWAEPRFLALPDDVKKLYAAVAALAPTFDQDKDLGCSFPNTPEGEALRRDFEAMAPDVLERAALIINDWGHWGHTRSITVHYPGMPPKRFLRRPEDPFSPKNDARDWVEALDAYGTPAPKDAVRFDWEHAGPPSEHAGAHWKFGKLVDKVLADQPRRTKEELRRELGWPASDPDGPRADEPFMDHKPGTKYDRDEQHHLLNALLGAEAPLRCRRVAAVNFRPHPFVIGPKHIELSGGILDEEALRRAPCAHRERGHLSPRCDLSYDQHVHDTVAFMELKRPVTKQEAVPLLQSLEPTMQQHGIDGFAFLDTGHRFVDDDDDADPA